MCTIMTLGYTEMGLNKKLLRRKKTLRGCVYKFDTYIIRKVFHLGMVLYSM